MAKQIHKKLCFGCNGVIEEREEYYPGPDGDIAFESSMHSGWHPKCKARFELNNACDFASQFYYNLPED